MPPIALTDHTAARRRRALLAAAITVAAMAAVPATAGAGTYTAQMCRTIDGGPASTAGLAPTGKLVTDPPSATTQVGNGCPDAGFRVAASLPGSNNAFGLKLTLPAGLTIRSAKLNRFRQLPAAQAGVVSGVTTNVTELREEGLTGTVLEQCPGDSCRGHNGPLDYEPVHDDVNGLDLRLACVQCGGAVGVLEIKRAELVLADVDGPKFNAPPAGPLTDPTRGALTGPTFISFGATDVGGGLSKALLEVDGKVVAERALGGQLCVEPYVTLQPCATEALSLLEFDTATLADGPHKARLIVRDLVGNDAVAGDYPIVTKNAAAPAPGGPGGPPAPAPAGAAGPDNGVNASRQAAIAASFSTKRRQISKTVSYSAKVPVYGSLTGPGGPIGNAEVVVLGRTMMSGARFRVLGTVRTGADGRFSYQLAPGGPSLQIVLGYRAHSADAEYTATAQLTLIRRAAVKLTAPASAHNRQRVQFCVSLLGTAHAKKSVELQWLSGGKGWQTFASRRTNGKGKVCYSYRFLRTYRCISYRFRALVPTTNDFPYEGNNSKARTMRVC